MNTDIKVINVEYNLVGKPDKKGIGRQLLKWLHRGYRLVERAEIIGERKSQNYTMLTFAKEISSLR
jgi:hypothetical protein